MTRDAIGSFVVAVLGVAGAMLGCSGSASVTAPNGSARGATDGGAMDGTTADANAPDAHAPIALVYRNDTGAAGCDGCALAVATLLQGSKWGFDVRFVGPHETTALTAETLAGATLYAQPGGSGTVSQAFAEMKPYAALITSFVQQGGRYLGFCMGGYLAGLDPGFNLLPGDSQQFVNSPGSNMTSTADTVVPVVWRGANHTLYFQDGPYFTLNAGATGVTVLGTYASNGAIASMVADYGKGKVGVVGPHPEATADWYAAYGLTNPEGIHPDVGYSFIDAVMP